MHGLVKMKPQKLFSNKFAKEFLLKSAIFAP